MSAVIPKTTATATELARPLERAAAGEQVGLDESMKGERSRVEGPSSPCEQEVLALLALGMSNAEIARAVPVGRHDQDSRPPGVQQAWREQPTQAAMRVLTAQKWSAPSARSEETELTFWFVGSGEDSVRLDVDMQNVNDGSSTPGRRSGAHPHRERPRPRDERASSRTHSNTGAVVGAGHRPLR
ncbi:MAG: hypothetical protein R2697_19380 [Ilumatobacteraceae bacterium]